MSHPGSDRHQGLRVAYHCGGWVTNVGNAFYNLGIERFLVDILGRESVYLVPDIANWIWQSPNSYDVTNDIDADLWILSGPTFSKGITGYRKFLDRLAERRKMLAFVSVGCWEYTDEEWQTVSALLEPHLDRLLFISTRDHRTYERAQSLGVPCYDGICGSMFLDDAVTVPMLDRSPYVVLNFGTREEPDLEYRDGTFFLDPRLPDGRARWRDSRVGRKLFGDPEARQWPSTCAGFDIVRTRSGGFDKSANIVFDRPDLHFADIPFGFLPIYRSAETVFTDRVHTAAATLILGGKARYVFSGDRARDGRWSLLQRVGAGAVVEQPTTLDQALVAEEKAAMTTWVATQLGRYSSSDRKLE